MTSSRRQGAGRGGAAVPWLLLVSLLAPTPLVAARSGEAAETFEGTTSVVVVEVPVQVVDPQGVPIRGLGRDNFEILDDGREREIAYFEVFDRGQTTSGRADVAPVARRHFLLLFDLSFSNPSAILRAREAAIGVLGDLHATDLVAVGTFSLLRGTQLLLSFTSDRRQAELAIDTLGAPQLVDRSPDPLALMISAGSRGPEGISSAQPGPPSSGGEARSAREEVVQAYLQELEVDSKRIDRESQTARVQGFVRSMADLAGLMRSVDGRKFVVLLSEGFDSRLLTGEGGADEDRSRAIESGELWSVDTDEMYGSGRLQNSLEAMLEELRRADCAIEAVDIGGLRAPGEGGAGAAGEEGLFAMARGTGGDLYRNFSDLGEAMEGLLDRTSVTYVLGFQPPDLAPDGKYRKLRVRLRNAPRGARIVHRPGYFAPSPGAPGPQQQRLDVASELLSGRPGGAIDVGVLAVPVAVAGERPALPVLVEIDGDSLLGATTGGEVTAEIYAYVLDGAGGVADYLYQTVGLDLAKVGARVRQGGVKFYGSFDLDPGSYGVRVLVRNGRTGATGLAVTAVEVPAFDSGRLALLPPLLPEMSFDRWLMVRQSPVPGGRQVPYPFILGEGQSFVPAAEPTVASGRATQVGVFAYNLGAEATVNAQVINAAGDVVLGQQLPIVQRIEGAAGGPTRLIAALDLPGVPAGEYTLTLGVFSAGSGERGYSSLPIRVTPAAPGSGTGVATAPPAQIPSPAAAEAGQAPLLSGRDSERLAQIEVSYREILSRLSAGFQQEAESSLAALELAEAAQSDDVLLGVLRQGEIAAARQLAEKDPAALIPVMLLHEAAYLGYRDRDQRIVARHGREMVRELAELYVRSGGEPTSLAASVFTSLGGSLQQAGLTASANALFERALDLDPGNEGALLSLAIYHEKVGLYERAISYLERLAEAHPRSSEGWLRMGVNLARLGKEEAAARWLGRAQGPEAEAWVRSVAFQQVASAALADGELERAEATLRSGLDQLPGDQRLCLQLSMVLDRRSRPGEARAALEALKPAAEAGESSPRYVYNRWPVHVLEIGRRELATNAVSRLPVLARVIRGLAQAEWAR